MTGENRSERPSHPDLAVRALTPARFDEVVELFGTRGDPWWCWCQFFVTTGSDYTGSADDNREALRAQAARRPRPGLPRSRSNPPLRPPPSTPR